MFVCTEIRLWSRGKLVQYLRLLFGKYLDDNDFAILLQNNVSGSIVQFVTAEDLASYGMSELSADCIVCHFQGLKDLQELLSQEADTNCQAQDAVYHIVRALGDMKC